MPEEESKGNDLEAGRELVRVAAKWFVAALGAIGAVLVAGSQLSSIGSLPGDSARLYTAIAGVVVGLAAILWAMFKVVDILAGRRWTIEQLASEWKALEKADQEGGLRKANPFASRHPVARFFRDNPSHLGSFASLVEVERANATGEFEGEKLDINALDELVDQINDLNDKASYIDLKSRFTAVRHQVAAAVVLASAGIIAFAWAANPEKPEQPAPTLRNADLTGADLRGTGLRNVDLTGAKLTRADLTGADLKGAKLDGVVWEDTTCPDGTNSDAVARPTTTSRLVGATCEGHLTP